MGRPKSLLVSMEITVAGKSHNCRFNDGHRIAMGDKRLTIKTDDGPHHYCLPCARTFLARDTERLRGLFSEIEALLQGG